LYQPVRQGLFFSAVWLSFEKITPAD